MSDVVTSAVTALSEKLSGDGFDSKIKIVIENEGSIIIDGDGARAGDDDDADCTMTASADTLQGMLDGSVNPTAAFMGGQLSVEGDMSVAMKLGSVLA
ncbi:MAG: SCP2 sterol-binding domain-containing protein [Pseudomonadota bacterium]